MREPLMQWCTLTPQQMEEVGAQLASSLPPRSDAAIVVYLSGDLGAGKTTLAKGFVRGCGIQDVVRSPTYALLEPYEGSNLAVLHLDLYRLHDPTELEPLGLRDWARPGHVWLIEWPDRGGSRLPSPDLQLTLTVSPGAHLVTATAASHFGQVWLAQARENQE